MARFRSIEGFNGGNKTEYFPEEGDIVQVLNASRGAKDAIGIIGKVVHYSTKITKGVNTGYKIKVNNEEIWGIGTKGQLKYQYKEKKLMANNKFNDFQNLIGLVSHATKQTAELIKKHKDVLNETSTKEYLVQSLRNQTVILSTQSVILNILEDMRRKNKPKKVQVVNDYM